MTECARCGDCCENIVVDFTLDEVEARARQWRKFAAWASENLDHPEANPIDDWRERMAACLDNAAKLPDLWSATGHTDDDRIRYECVAFDPNKRICTVHDDRPAICRDYPWYGDPPRERGLATLVSPRCSFVADVTTVLPLVSVNGKAV